MGVMEDIVTDTAQNCPSNKAHSSTATYNHARPLVFSCLHYACPGIAMDVLDFVSYLLN